ncbi:MAG TPA: alkaline phosphatase family protein [Anaerolineales bacterium]|nr:alkaline phosphatase family protein [Anaerolineales bacterium]HNN12979.1 alkaline phosphatase family protein [Anaerolineales bacterium]HNO30712.1 alkaline phosphatase family protein [Anaerolineales bacterium]
MNKVILILSDALRYDVAKANMGFLGHLVESGQASLYRIIGELPSLSRPMYETIHTGLSSSEHGVVANSIVRLSDKPNIFRSLKEAGKITAAAAYYWYSELYNRAPYDPIADRETDNLALNIQHGRFYTEDDYPDIELFRSAAHLVRKFSPDYLLLHPMGMDYRGETHGADSKQYRSHAVYQDGKLAPLIMEWRERGYTVLVTGDHGINADGDHGGTTSEQRDVPLYVIPPNGRGRGDTGEIVSHLQIAPSVLSRLNVPIPDTMKRAPLSFD